MNNFLNYDSDHVGLSFFIGAAILIISHGIHVVDPNYHLFFQICFIIGYTLFMITPLLKGKKMNIYKTLYKLSIIVIVIIGIVLDNMYLHREKENEENEESYKN
tara:strand:+ start:214 stop:525 length:312 start_codon:yes stop_codon:yes gene_type:complete